MKEILRNCPICETGDYSTFTRREQQGAVIKIGKEHFNERHVFCEKCGLIYINPVLDQESLDTFYEKHYRDLYSEDDHTEYELAAALPRVDFLKTILPKERNNVIDIGSSMGWFPYLLKTSKWKNMLGILKSVEPNKKHCGFYNKYLKSEHINTSIEKIDVDKHRHRYEVVTCFDCFEHLLDPGKFLDIAFELLNSNGILYIETPTVTLPRIHSLAIFSAAHTCVYSEETIEFILEKHGFYIDYMDFDGNRRDMRIIAKKMQNLENKRNLFNKSIKLKDLQSFWGNFNKLSSVVLPPVKKITDCEEFLKTYKKLIKDFPPFASWIAAYCIPIAADKNFLDNIKSELYPCFDQFTLESLGTSRYLNMIFELVRLPATPARVITMLNYLEKLHPKVHEYDLPGFINKDMLLKRLGGMGFRYLDMYSLLRTYLHRKKDHYNYLINFYTTKEEDKDE